MKSLKVSKFYDICCEKCGRWMSTDFGIGMAYSTKQARRWAKEQGFKVDKKTERTLCPYCCEEKKC